MNGPEKRYQALKAYVRFRPFNQSEIEAKSTSLIKKISPRELVIKSKYNEKKYNFDRVFGEEATQKDVYDVVIAPLINDVVSGYNCTIFAYGQIGTGKTYTMQGEKPSSLDVYIYNNDSPIGMVPRAGANLFSKLIKLDLKTEYTVRLSYIEIYNEEVRDLLSEGHPLRVYDDPSNKGSVYLKGLSEVTICSPRDLHDWLYNIGALQKQRSRSHTIISLLVSTREITSDGEELIKTGKLQLIELAACDNSGRSRESATINKSISTLSKVINALSQKMQHIPYRDSKLTRILQDSLGGSAKTCMIATVSPTVTSWEETVATLDCAQVARGVTNSPFVNVNKKQTNFLKELQEEIDKLKKELEATRRGTGFYLDSETYEQMMERKRINTERILDLIVQIKELEQCKRDKEEEYQRMLHSFEQTRAYVESLKQELQLKKAKREESEATLNNVMRRAEELSKTANELLNICETSTKREEIYHSKYQNQCKATISNADVVKKITSMINDCLKEIQNVSEIHKKREEEYVDGIKKCLKAFKEDGVHDLQQLSQMVAEVETQACNYKDFNLDSVLKCENANFSEDNIQNFFTSRCDNRLLQLQELNKIKDSLQVLKGRLMAKSEDIEKKSARCLEVVESGLLQKQEHQAHTKETLLKMRTVLRDRQKLVEKRLEKTRKMKTLIKEQIASIDEENTILLKQDAALQDLMKDLNHTSYTTRKVTQEIKSATVDYLANGPAVMEEQLCILDDIRQNVDEIHDKTKIQMSADECSVDQYLTNLTQTIKNNLNLQNTDVKGVFQNWGNKICGIKDSMFKTAQECSESIEKNISFISDSKSVYNSDVKKIISKSREEIEGMKENIVVTTRAGDTPVKVTYKLPQIKK